MRESKQTGALPFVQKIDIQSNYAQLITRPLNREARFNSIQIFWQKARRAA